MRRHFPWLVTLAVSLWMSHSAAAHFLWVVMDTTGSSARLRVYFGESAAPDDPALLDRFSKLEATILTGSRNEPRSVALQKKDGALEAELSPGAPASAALLRHDYGVVSRGGEQFLLKYYAKSYPFPLPGTWRPVGNKELLPLEIEPSADEQGALTFRVTWQGAAAAGAAVTVQGPGVDVEGMTDAKGDFRCEAAQSGLLSVRVRHVEANAGEADQKKYDSVRHYSTLALHYVRPQLQPLAGRLPDLPHGTTSFGGAVLGDTVYLYGGNYGSAHEYSHEGQSGDMWRLDLRTPENWERVLAGPKRQGLAMVESHGALYRVGGFMAMNKEGEEEDLRSQTDFARWIPGQSEWESLPPLPEARSSHDAAVVGDTLFVVGGWNLRGRGAESQWHETAWKIDLRRPTDGWTPIAPPPFKRRALALAAWQHKLYCIGGMSERGVPTTAVAVFDPRSNTWSEGSRLLGGGMEGFGASAFAAGDALYVTTMSGSIQRLSTAGAKWEYLGQLSHPRFFHRLLPWQDRQLIVVGGAHMSAGKIEPVEVIEVPE